MLLGDFVQAVMQFYHSSGGQAEINRWLTNAQISPNAWSFAWQLIQPQKVRFEYSSEYKYRLKTFYWLLLLLDHCRKVSDRCLGLRENCVTYSSKPRHFPLHHSTNQYANVDSNDFFSASVTVFVYNARIKVSRMCCVLRAAAAASHAQSITGSRCAYRHAHRPWCACT